MTSQELISFDNALLEQRFTDYEVRIIKAIFTGNGNLAQEDILRTSDYGIKLLRKLGWYLRVKNAIKKANLHLLDNNQIRI